MSALAELSHRVLMDELRWAAARGRELLNELDRRDAAEATPGDRRERFQLIAGGAA
jgi:hypothetical protein